MTAPWNPVHLGAPADSRADLAARLWVCPTCGANARTEPRHRLQGAVLCGLHVSLVVCPQSHEVKIIQRGPDEIRTDALLRVHRRC